MPKNKKAICSFHILKGLVWDRSKLFKTFIPTPISWLLFIEDLCVDALIIMLDKRVCFFKFFNASFIYQIANKFNLLSNHEINKFIVCLLHAQISKLMLDNYCNLRIIKYVFYLIKYQTCNCLTKLMFIIFRNSVT